MSVLPALIALLLNVLLAISRAGLGVVSAADGPGLNVLKEADADAIDAGEEASFTITIWNTGPGDALDVELRDDLPVGLAWDLEIVNDPDEGTGDAVDCNVASSAVPGGQQAVSFSCALYTVEPSGIEDAVEIRVFADTHRTECGMLENTAEVTASNLVEQLGLLGDEEPSAVLRSTDTIAVRCAEFALEIDKVASVETITIGGPNNALVATPSVVTWTLSYTLTDGPVTGAVITDQVPTGFTFLDAANGGTFAAGTVTWNLGTLTSSGSVSFRTTVDPATISRVAPTVNTAVIDSNETAPDDGQDSVTVTVVPPPLGGTPTPRPSLPNTAIGTGIDGGPVSVPVELMVAVFLGSLGALAFANVRARRER